MTPSGEVVPDSATDVGENRIRYTTSDGSRYEVTASPNGTGGYRYNYVERVDDAD